MASQLASAVPATGIVADDLTGATDSAVQFTRLGWAARMALTTPDTGSARAGEVIALVTDARAAGPAAARSSTSAAVEALLASGASRLFLKIDSTLRGTVNEQIEGALEVWSKRHPKAVAIVCSAYPAMGRTVEHGRILVDGRGVETTAIGTDPVTPVATSELCELIPGSTHVALRGTRPSQNVAQLRAAIDGGARIITVDAVTDEDLTRIAEATNLLGDEAIPVGAGGLATAIARSWSSAPPGHALPPAEASRVVVVVSSLHDSSRAQSDYLLAHYPAERTLVLAPALDLALNPAGIIAWVEQEFITRGPIPELVIVISPLERPAETALGETTAAELVADSLAAVTRCVLETEGASALMLMGGEGAKAVLSRLGAHSLLVRDAIREGIPIGSVEGGIADGVTFVTKAGGFGVPQTVHDIVTELIALEGNK